MTVSPFSLDSCCRADRNSSLYRISRKEVGSSSTRISGSWLMALASMTLCLWPSLIFVKSTSASSDTPTSSIASSTALLSRADNLPNLPV